MTRRARTRLGGGLLAAVLALGLLAEACHVDTGADEWLEDMASAHRAADDALERGQPEAARQVLLGAVRRPAPDDVNATDRRVVRQDLSYRLAELDLSQDRATAARDWADLGLSLGRGGDVFEVNLLIARGRARERLGLDAAAADDFYEGLRIADRLLQQQLAPEGSQ